MSTGGTIEEGCPSLRQMESLYRQSLSQPGVYFGKEQTGSELKIESTRLKECRKMERVDENSLRH